MIVLDASVLIAYLNPQDQHDASAHSILYRSVSDEFLVSVVTMAEVLVGPTRSQRLDRAHTVLHELGLSTIGIDASAPTELARIQAETNLKLPDCCVLLAAEQTGGRLATFDARLADVARRRGLEVVTD